MSDLIPDDGCIVNQNCVRPSRRQYITYEFNRDFPLDWVLNRIARDGYYVQQVYFQDHYKGQVIAWMRK